MLKINYFKKVLFAVFFLVLLPVLLMAQDIRFTGKVTDKNNDPVSGATVMVKDQCL
jgi:hypothetical protein